MQSSPIFFYLVPHRLKYLHQHPILKHCNSMFLPKCEKPRFTLIEENRRNYISLYINIYIYICFNTHVVIISSIPNFSKFTGKTKKLMVFCERETFILLSHHDSFSRDTLLVQKKALHLSVKVTHKNT